MKTFFQNIFNWIVRVFFQTDITVPPKPIPTPTPTPPPVVVPPAPPKQTKLELWIKYIALMEGARADRNNPGNLRFVGQQYAFNDNGFCKFDTLEHGENALKNLLINACEGQSHTYPPGLTLYKFQCIYSPKSDGNDPLHYATFVAEGIAKVYPEITINTLIRDLLT